MIHRLLLAAACAASATVVWAQTPVPTRQVGALTLEGVPEIPASEIETQRRYQDARSAAFRDWLADGSMLITTRFGNTAQVHRVAGPGMARTQLTFDDDPVSAVEAQPGAQRFVYSRDEGGAEYWQAWLREVDGGETQFTEPGTRNSGFVFSPDGRRLAWARTTRGDPNIDIQMMTVGEPASRRVVHEGTGAMSVLDFSPDGRGLLLGRNISAAESERFLLDIATGRLTEIKPTDRKIAYGGGEFTPDGRGVILTSDDGSEVSRLVRLDLATGRETVLSESARWEVDNFDLSDDGRRLAYSTNEDGYSRLRIIDPATGRAVRGPELPDGVVGGLEWSNDGRKLAITLTTPTSSADVWSWDGTRLERWTFSELGGVDRSKLVAPTLVRVRSFDGLQVPAFVYRPKGAQGRLPVVISIHGGPEGQSRPVYGTPQMWVSELGAAVIVPNVRGSTGYGKAYLAADNAEKREDSVRDIGAILDWIATQPDLDPSRVVVHGGSYGGYMVLASMAHYAPRLAGGVDLFGISNWISFLQNTEGYRRDLRRVEYGDERDPAMRAVFERISPLNMSQRMTKPMMVYQGVNDPRVPKSESDQLVRRLREQGVEVWYVVAADEGHSLARKANAEVVRAAETMFMRRLFATPQPVAAR
jgi:dipeptidyl aminopeptidase/acylaminoacyl peptidase